VQADFNSGTHTLTTPGDGTLHFVSGPFSGESFLFSNDGSGGTDITVIHGSEISTTITSTVTVGSTAYPSPLTITNTGVIAPQAVGAIGVLSDISGNVLTNNGAIDGGEGGGLGLKVEMAATLTNNGSITGGAGGSGAGGAGADLLAGTLTNTVSLAGGAGASNNKGLPGGAGGAGAVLNGGTLITSGTISGGAGGTGSSNGAMGDAVKFGTTASTLDVDSGAAFHGAIGGFGIGDTVDITNLTPAQVKADFNTSTHVLTTGVDGTLKFTGAFTNEHFVFTAAGTGTDVTLASGPGAMFAALGNDVLNFVSDYHRGLIDGRIMPVHGLGSSLLSTASAAASDHTSYGVASHAFVDHGFTHPTFDVCKVVDFRS
jgi:hypothetical protein